MKDEVYKNLSFYKKYHFRWYFFVNTYHSDKSSYIYDIDVKEMNQELKDKLEDYTKIAHIRFDYALTETINTAHGIASVDNAIYDMEKKHKVKSLTKPNDDQK